VGSGSAICAGRILATPARARARAPRAGLQPHAAAALTRPLSGLAAWQPANHERAIVEPASWHRDGQGPAVSGERQRRTSTRGREAQPTRAPRGATWVWWRKVSTMPRPGRLRLGARRFVR